MQIGNFDPSSAFFFIAGPCVVEGRDMMLATARRLAAVAAKYSVPLVLKGSFKKANRTGAGSFMTIGEEAALEILASAGSECGLPTLTDIHSTEDAMLAAGYADVLQIPAFLCRQTELIQAAVRTGRAVNIKKGQFAAPGDMVHAVEKGRAAGGDTIMLCERGTTFGYHDLVVDMRGLVIMRSANVPVIYDATHSVQVPSAGGVSGGRPEFILPLARAAVAVGVNGVFFETHPDPPSARSDAASQLPLAQAEEFIRQCLHSHRFHETL